MSDSTTPLDNVLGTSSFADREAGTAIDLLGTWVDAAWDARRADVLRHLAQLASTIRRDAAKDSERALLDYYLANLWAGVKYLAGPHQGGSWDWEQSAIEQEVTHLRRAIRSPGCLVLPPIRVCQFHTNLGNCFSNIGRFAEAVDAWNDALAIEPTFGMARGNRACGLWTYARTVYDPGHAIVMAREAWRALDPQTLKGVEPGADKHFHEIRLAIEAALPSMTLQQEFDLNAFSLGDSDTERAYRRWCLERRLFLNPLNDIGSIRIAAADVLSCPSIVAKINEGPRFHDFFNQIKQEFCSARWLAFQATLAPTAHFSDREVLLYNTLDYPSYGLHTEKLKLAFRATYSLLDKIAFFLNAYMDLGIAERNVSFRGLWYKEQRRSKGLRDEFRSRANWALRGLYWLSKDLYEDASGFRDAMDPAAERLSEIRNHLEHKYLKLHSDLWGGPASSIFTDGLAVSLRLDEFAAMTIRLLSMTRAAIIYLSLGVHREEQVRAGERDPKSIIPPMFLDTWEDEWKE